MIVVFRTDMKNTYYIKRIIGLQTVQIVGRRIYLYKRKTA